MVHILLYDIKLQDAPETHWSPNTSKTRYTLNYKGIPYKTVWLAYSELSTEVPKLTKKESPITVPIIVDLLHDNTVVQDSWDIANYLEEAYPENPSVFNGNMGVHLFFYNYCDSKLLLTAFKISVFGILGKIGEDADYYRKSREDIFGMTLEEVVGDSASNEAELTTALEPIGKILNIFPYMSGEQAGWADLVLAAYFRLIVEGRPESFTSLVLNNTKAGDAFTTWWKRMEKYMRLEPPSHRERMIL
ncbi:hypothetical protein BJV82DRAFT_606709 [Fennellomyces sp. T-0311]|nr:hypothetical protein BJV82DRAFT_606709 [Fennellomyces sp. T-0311]